MFSSKFIILCGIILNAADALEFRTSSSASVEVVDDAPKPTDEVDSSNNEDTNTAGEDDGSSCCWCSRSTPEKKKAKTVTKQQSKPSEPKSGTSGPGTSVPKKSPKMQKTKTVDQQQRQNPGAVNTDSTTSDVLRRGEGRESSGTSESNPPMVDMAVREAFITYTSSSDEDESCSVGEVELPDFSQEFIPEFIKAPLSDKESAALSSFSGEVKQRVEELKKLLPNSFEDFGKAFNTKAKKNEVARKVEEAFDAVRLLLLEGEYILKLRYRSAHASRDAHEDSSVTKEEFNDFRKTVKQRVRSSMNEANKSLQLKADFIHDYQPEEGSDAGVDDPFSFIADTRNFRNLIKTPGGDASGKEILKGKFSSMADLVVQDGPAEKRIVNQWIKNLELPGRGEYIDADFLAKMLSDEKKKDVLLSGGDGVFLPVLPQMEQELQKKLSEVQEGTEDDLLKTLSSFFGPDLIKFIIPDSKSALNSIRVLLEEFIVTRDELLQLKHFEVGVHIVRRFISQVLEHVKKAIAQKLLDTDMTAIQLNLPKNIMHALQGIMRRFEEIAADPENAVHVISETLVEYKGGDADQKAKRLFSFLQKSTTVSAGK